MTIVRLFSLGTVIGVCLSGAASAAGVEAPNDNDPASIQKTAFNYNHYVYSAAKDAPSESPSDAPAAAAEAAPAVGVCDTACCDPCCRTRCSGLGDPWKLPQPCALACRGIEVGGWVSAGIYANEYGDNNNGPLGFNDVANFTMNQMWVYFDKATDTGGYGVDWGGRIDYIFGADGPDTQAFGDGDWDGNWDTSRDYGSAMPQVYVELAINDWTIKGGRFYTIIGYEVVQAPDNFFYTHAYTMYYGEPFTHTGVLASYKASERVTVHAGWTDGWDNGWQNINGASTLLAGVSLSLSDDATLTWACSTGSNGRAGGEDRGDVYMNSIVFDWALTDRLTYIFQHDLGNISGLGADNSQWYGINQYLQYQLSERWAAGARFEWFRDDDGQRVPVPEGGGDGFGNEGNYYEVTLGLNWKPHANVTVRPELRYDWYDGNYNSGAEPFNDGTASEQFSGGFDFIVTY